MAKKKETIRTKTATYKKGPTPGYGKMKKEPPQPFLKREFRVGRVAINPGQFMFVISVVLILLAVVLIAPVVQDVFKAKTTEADYVKEHTAGDTNIVPSVVGTMFKIKPRATGETKIEGRFWVWEGNYEDARIYWFDPQDSGGQIYIPEITPITNASYTTDVAALIDRRDMSGLTNPLSVKCWTNNPISEPKKFEGMEIHKVQMKITVYVEYETATGDIDTKATKQCTIPTTVYFYYRDPGTDPGTYEYAQDYDSTYVYVPFNIRPRYNNIVLKVQGEYQKIHWEDEWLGGGKETENTGVQPYTINEPGKHQPVWYRYPLKYTGVGGTSGGVLP